MANAKRISSIIINQKQYSPASDSWTMAFGGYSRERIKYADGTSAIKETPESDVSSGDIRAPQDMTDLQNLARNGTIFTVTATASDGTRWQGRDCVIQNHPEVNSDGNVSLEIAGEGQWI